MKSKPKGRLFYEKCPINMMLGESFYYCRVIGLDGKDLWNVNPKHTMLHCDDLAHFAEKMGLFFDLENQKGEK